MHQGHAEACCGERLGGLQVIQLIGDVQLDAVLVQEVLDEPAKGAGGAVAARHDERFTGECVQRDALLGAEVMGGGKHRV